MNAIHPVPGNGEATVRETIEALPLVTLCLTERCNSRCVTCDYWRHGRKDVSAESVSAMLPELEALGAHVIVFSGGEPLLNPEWRPIAELLKSRGFELWLLTAGLALAKHARAVADQFSSVTVSLDGTDPAMYAAIRGVTAFDKVCEGIRAVASMGVPVTIRVTLQRANYRELPRFVELAHELGAQQISFLGADVSNSHAFARQENFSAGIALDRADLPVLEGLIDEMQVRQAHHFSSGFIAESPDKLRRIRQYFAALVGESAFPAVRCNAPEFSAVVGVEGAVSPCHFISGPPNAAAGSGLRAALNSAAMTELRATIRAGGRPECERCVCSMWRDPATLAARGFEPSRGRHG
jgi:MoaA/NifB/PqqE/SkfB family radical SAM enzyme